LIIGIGTDLCRITPIRRSIRRFGERFTSKFCSELERGWIDLAPDPGLLYAQGFAAKEALAKALGTGFGEDIVPFEIELSCMRPPITIVLAGGARRKLSALVPGGMSASMHVSIGACLDFASASAVISTFKVGERIENDRSRFRE
jgi:holo-[acyl-carrier protein] synthase